MAQNDEQMVSRMRARAEQCRRLARAMTDKHAAAALLKMAEEVEADIGRLDGDRIERQVPNPMQLPPESA